MKYLIITFSIIISLASCKNNNSQVQEDAYSTETLDSVFQFKEIGNLSSLDDYIFASEWKIDPYQNELELDEEDINAQEKLEEIDYFNKLKVERKLETDSKYFDFLKKDNFYKEAKIDSAFVINNNEFNNDVNVIAIKSYGNLLDQQYEMPVPITNVDLILLQKDSVLSSVNIYREVVYPYNVQLKIGFLNTDGNILIKSFEMDEQKVHYKKYQKENIIDLFQLKSF